MRKVLLGVALVSLMALTSGVASAQKQSVQKQMLRAVSPAALFPDCTLVGANLVANCGFETGDFTGWTHSGETINDSVVAGAAHSGAFGAALGPVNHQGLLSQVLTTVPNQTYTLDIWVQNSGRPSQFEVWWNGDRLSQITTLPDFSYTEFTYTVTATGAAADLTFNFSNAPAFIYLDDITVTP